MFVVKDAFYPVALSVKPLAAGTENGWGSAVFSAIAWQRFEAVCEALFAQSGFQIRSQSHGANGGLDLWLHSAHASGAVAMVQCKHWHINPVGQPEMQAFFNAMCQHQIKRGTYVTTSNYTSEAKQFAKANGINTMDGPALLALIARRSPEQQQALLTVAYQDAPWRPTCARCGVKLAERPSARKPLSQCTNYPHCRTTLPLMTRRDF